LTPELKDGAGLFKAESVRKANETIKQTKQLKKDLVIETFDQVPAWKGAARSPSNSVAGTTTPYSQQGVGAWTRRTQ
jgi:hypothetical protein